MKTTKLFFMAALALTFAACSNDDNDFENPAQQPAEAQGIPFTATISMGGDKATTRALSENGSGLTATWAVDEEVALIHNGVIDKVTVASVDGNVATISGTITTDDNGAEVTVIFPYSAVDLVTKDVKAELLYTQSGGTLADVAAKYDVRKGDGTLKVDGTATLNGEVTLDNQFAIWKLTLNESAKDLYITADGVLIAGATRSSAGTEFYVAVPEVVSKTVAAVATDGISNSWFFSKAGVSLAAGKYYQSSPTMTAVDDDSSADVYKMTEADYIPDGKTVVLSGVTSGGISCDGDATIILMGTNTIDEGLQASPTDNTMTITGTGSLNARSNGSDPGIGAVGSKCGNITICGGTIIAQPGYYSDGYGAGIGSGESGRCGNITICGGEVTATGGEYGAGIGSGFEPCGNITICGGTVTATGGEYGAGIGSAEAVTCGTVTITDGVTSVTATKGNNAQNSIGKGDEDEDEDSSCGTVTIGGTVYWDGSIYQNGGDTYLTQSTLIYEP